MQVKADTQKVIELLDDILSSSTSEEEVLSAGSEYLYVGITIFGLGGYADAELNQILIQHSEAGRPLIKTVRESMEKILEGEAQNGL